MMVFTSAQNAAALLRREQNVERLGRGHQNVRRPLQHALALLHERVTGADRGANLRHQQAFFAGQRRDFAQRAFQVFLDVVAQRLQRRDVQDFSPVGEIAAERFAHQAVNADQERRQRLAGAGGRGDERGPAGQNMGPALLLRLGGRAEFVDEPFLDQGVGPGEGFRDRGMHLAIVTVFVKDSPKNLDALKIQIHPAGRRPHFFCASALCWAR